RRDDDLPGVPPPVEARRVVLEQQRIEEVVEEQAADAAGDGQPRRDAHVTAGELLAQPADDGAADDHQQEVDHVPTSFRQRGDTPSSVPAGAAEITGRSREPGLTQGLLRGQLRKPTWPETPPPIST